MKCEGFTLFQCGGKRRVGRVAHPCREKFSLSHYVGPLTYRFLKFPIAIIKFVEPFYVLASKRTWNCPLSRSLIG